MAGQLFYVHVYVYLTLPQPVRNVGTCNHYRQVSFSSRITFLNNAAQIG